MGSTSPQDEICTRVETRHVEGPSTSEDDIDEERTPSRDGPEDRRDQEGAKNIYFTGSRVLQKLDSFHKLL